MAKKILGVIDMKALLLKTLVGGAMFGLVSWAINALIVSLTSMQLGWMQYVLLILASVGLMFAMKFRDGVENYFEALISAGFVFGLFGLVDYIFHIRILTAYQSIGLYEVLMFFALFFTAEGISQRALKAMKLLRK